MTRLSVRQSLIAAGLLIGIAWLAYANSFQADFHFDDYTYIVHKPELRDITDWRAIYRALGHPSRFIAFYSFALNHHFHGYDVFGYHAVNWVIHVINAGLLCMLVWLLLQTPHLKGRLPPDRRYACALLAALLFVAHPLQTEAVTYVVQRFTSLATLFYLAAMVFYLRGRLKEKGGAAWDFGLFAAFTVLGMFTKQICFTIPLMILWLEWCCFNTGAKDWLRARWRFMLVLAVLLLIVPSFFRFDAADILGRQVPSRSHTGETLNAYRYALTQTRVIPTYLRLTVFPVGQTLDYDFPATANWREPKALAGAFFLLGLMGAGVALRRRAPEVTLAVGWLFIALSVTSSIIPIPHVIFEHRMYLPSAGIFFLAAFGVCRFVERGARLTAVGAVAVMVLTVLTYQRNAVWRTDRALWSDILSKAPGKLRAYNNFGMAELEAGRAAESLMYFDQALARNPGAGRVYNNRGLAYLALGDEERALADFTKAIALLEGSQTYHEGRYKRIWAQVYFNRGRLLLKTGNVSGALTDWSEALRINPRHTGALHQMARWHERSGEFDTAADFYRRLAEVDPRQPKAYIGLGYIAQYRGEDRRAVQLLNRAAELDPNDGEALFFRAISRFNLRDTDGARKDMQAAVRLGYRADSAELQAARETILGLE